MSSRLVQPAVLGGLLIGVLSVLPIVNVANCCCLWVIGGGVLAAYLLQQNELAPITFADGALAGLGAGIVGALTWLVLFVPMRLLTGPLHNRMLERISNAPELPPELQESLRNMEAGGIFLPLVLGFGFMVVAALVFGTLGGLLGALIFRRTPPPTPPAPPIPPPPPAPPSSETPSVPPPPPTSPPPAY